MCCEVEKLAATNHILLPKAFIGRSTDDTEPHVLPNKRFQYTTGGLREDLSVHSHAIFRGVAIRHYHGTPSPKGNPTPLEYRMYAYPVVVPFPPYGARPDPFKILM